MVNNSEVEMNNEDNERQTFSRSVVVSGVDCLFHARRRFFEGPQRRAGPATPGVSQLNASDQHDGDGQEATGFHRVEFSTAWMLMAALPQRFMDRSCSRKTHGRNLTPNA